MKSITKGTLTVVACLLTAGIMTACSEKAKRQAQEAIPAKSEEAQHLLSNLKARTAQGFMFGHHDDPMYGIGWVGDEGRSDVKSVCGDYPGVMSFDLGELELGGEVSLDKVPFARILQEVVRQYERGGLASLSWHVRNPKTDGTAWDNSDSTVVRSILPGGECHEKFSGWLRTLADFLNSLQTADGTKVPVLFRPWHEHTGSWFWWGQALCTDDEYKTLWRMTADTLQAHGANHLLYAYSPGSEPQDTLQYLQRWPGDDLVDVVGFDTYQFDREAFLSSLNRMLQLTTAVAKSHQKVAAVTEIGYESIPDATWWTGTLLPAVEQYPLSYVLVWRNAHDKENHFYAPYPGHPSAADFVEFYKKPNTLFAADAHLNE